MKRQPLSEGLRRIWDAQLDPEEFHRRLERALADEEDMRQQVALCAWFSRRYRTGGERLAYVRRKYAEWTRSPLGCNGGPGEGE